MARIGFFCPPWAGHFNPSFALARELQRRGHEAVFFSVEEFGETVRARGFAFAAFGEDEFPPGELARRHEEMSRLEGLAAMEAGLGILTSLADSLFRTAPPVIRAARLDLCVVDHLDYAASTLVAVMRIRFVSLIVTLMRHHEDGVPGFSGEPFTDDPEVLARDQQFEETMLGASRPYRDYVSSFRMGAGLGPFDFGTLWSSLLQITQQPEAFEFPRRRLPGCFHFTGPFIDRSERPKIAFSWERLNGKPLVYASFGTMQNRNRQLYECVARAAAGMDAQVVVSTGGAELGDLPGDAVVVRFAPQLELLERAALMITHAGMNSALECLAAGVPMVAVPISHDQPGVAARIEWTGTGVRMPAAECDASRLRQAMEEVLGRATYREAAGRFARLIAEGDGLRKAAGLIESVAAES